METILVVDNEPFNLELLDQELSDAGYGTALADGGRKALERVHEGGVDMVLLDIMMPGMNGLEVLHALRETYSMADLPIVMVTARDHSDDIVESLTLGANDYVVKPIDVPVLLARVQTQLRLRRLIRLKDEFLRIASHDLKNPLMSVLSFGLLLRKMFPPDSSGGEQAGLYASQLYSCALQMGRIIEELLDFQVMEEGNLLLVPTLVDLNQLARNAVEGAREYARDKGIELTLALDGALPRVHADELRIGQVIQNFLSNAIKFLPPGGRVAVRTKSRDGEVVLKVVDNGPGLTREDLKKVFVKYARLSNKPTGLETSHGIGLAICKQLIELHGGQIGVHNNPRRGATFWFGLPTGKSDG